MPPWVLLTGLGVLGWALLRKKSARPAVTGDNRFPCYVIQMASSPTCAAPGFREGFIRSFESQPGNLVENFVCRPDGVTEVRARMAVDPPQVGRVDMGDLGWVDITSVERCA